MQEGRRFRGKLRLIIHNGLSLSVAQSSNQFANVTTPRLCFLTINELRLAPKSMVIHSLGFDLCRGGVKICGKLPVKRNSSPLNRGDDGRIRLIFQPPEKRLTRRIHLGPKLIPFEKCQPAEVKLSHSWTVLIYWPRSETKFNSIFLRSHSAQATITTSLRESFERDVHEFTATLWSGAHAEPHQTPTWGSTQNSLTSAQKFSRCIQFKFAMRVSPWWI